jgi:hypothetical protein
MHLIEAHLPTSSPVGPTPATDDPEIAARKQTLIAYGTLLGTPTKSPCMADNTETENPLGLAMTGVS